MITIKDALELFNLVLDRKDNITENDEVFATKGNMTNLIKKFIIRPTIIVNKDLKDNKYLSNIIEYQLSLFTSFYTMSFTTLVHLHGLEPEVAFNLLSSDVGFSKDGVFGGVEESNLFGIENLVCGLEAKTKMKLSGTQDSKSKISQVYTRNIEIIVKVSDDNGKTKIVKFPVVIQGNVKFVSGKTLSLMYSKEESQSPLDRIDDMQAGSIDFWKDFVFARDMIRDYKSRRLQDREDVIKALRERKYNSLSKVASNGFIGYNRYYQMLVITPSDVENIRKAFRGKLGNTRVRQQYLEETLSFSVSVVDDMHEYLDIYINGLENKIGTRLKDIKNSNKADEHMEELLKILTATRTI